MRWRRLHRAGHRNRTVEVAHGAGAHRRCETLAEINRIWSEVGSGDGKVRCHILYSPSNLLSLPPTTFTAKRTRRREFGAFYTKFELLFLSMAFLVGNVGGITQLHIRLNQQFLGALCVPAELIIVSLLCAV